MKLNHTASPIPASGFDRLLSGTKAQKHHRKSELRKPLFLCGKASVCPSWPPLVPSPLLPTQITSQQLHPCAPFSRSSQWRPLAGDIHVKLPQVRRTPN